MAIRMVIELSNQQSAQTVVNALENYKTRLRANIERTRQRLGAFEKRYGKTTEYFSSKMTAEDLPGGDLEYVEWAGENKLLNGLERELDELEHAHYQLP
ncbi:MAG: hypothetical protein HY327_01045 [Chloroflexi bacterium]|nr:hypothetical protein [Chloroflexota bacterium]